MIRRRCRRSPLFPVQTPLTRQKGTHQLARIRTFMTFFLLDADFDSECDRGYSPNRPRGEPSIPYGLTGFQPVEHCCLGNRYSCPDMYSQRFNQILRYRNLLRYDQFWWKPHRTVHFAMNCI